MGDAADGFPGIKGWGQRSASTVLAHYLHLEQIPKLAADWDAKVSRTVGRAERLAEALAVSRDMADLFKVLATLRVEPGLVESVDELEWRGPGPGFVEVAEHIGASGLVARAEALAERRR